MSDAINKLGGIERQKSVPQNGSFDWPQTDRRGQLQPADLNYTTLRYKYTYAPCHLVCILI